MTLATRPDLDPDCPVASVESTARPTPTAHAEPPDPASHHQAGSLDLVAIRRPFGQIDRSTWDGLAGGTPAATPFASWAFHRAWWDGYGAGAEDETLIVVDRASPHPDEPLAIVPLMRRRWLEPTDEAARTTMRHEGSEAHSVPFGASRVLFFGASYHADYATILCPPALLEGAAQAVIRALAAAGSGDEEGAPGWDAIDLRRLRCGDAAADALASAFADHGSRVGWTTLLEREDVCPVVTIADGLDFDAYLGTLGRKERHEIRRKIRRAEAAGPVCLDPSIHTVEDLDAFIDLHQKRWGTEGLFPSTPGGFASRTFFRRLFELCGAGGDLRLSFLTVGGRRIAAGVWFDDGQTLYYYNAGVEPEARDLSPGVNLVAASLREAVALGRHRFDFLRGDEGYKYEWGAVDEPIQRLLVVRTS